MNPLVLFYVFAEAQLRSRAASMRIIQHGRRGELVAILEALHADVTILAADDARITFEQNPTEQTMADFRARLVNLCAFVRALEFEADRVESGVAA